MKKLPLIKLSRNVDTPMVIDLTDFTFLPDSELVWTVKEHEYGEKLIEKTFTEPIKYEFTITPEEMKKLTGDRYYYDFVMVGDKKYKQCLISDVYVEGTIYGDKDI